MLSKVKIVYILVLLIVLLSCIIITCYDKFQVISFYYLSSSLFIIFPFISLFFILFINIKKINYQARKYDEISMISLIILGTMWLYSYTKLKEYIELVVAYSISGGLFVVVLILFIILNKFFGKIDGKARIIRNN